MSSKEKKKVKEKVVFKVPIWISALTFKDNKLCDVTFASDFLKEMNPNRAWKGKFILYNSHFVVKNNFKSFQKTCYFAIVKAVTSATFNEATLIIGILEDDVVYLMIKCNTQEDKHKILQGLDGKYSCQTISNTFINNTLNVHNNVSNNNPPNQILQPNRHGAYENEYENETDHEQMLGEHNKYNYKKKVSKTPIFDKAFRKDSHQNDQTIVEYDDIESGYQGSYSKKKDGMIWVEDTKFINFNVALGQNVETPDGSVFMYCAYEVVPQVNGYESYMD